ncbi:hypothetical protein ACFQ3L_05355, partial [Lacticaseibacillus jixianensis]
QLSLKSPITFTKLCSVFKGLPCPKDNFYSLSIGLRIVNWFFYRQCRSLRSRLRFDNVEYLTKPTKDRQPFFCKRPK